MQKDLLVFGEYYHVYPQLRKIKISFLSYTKILTEKFNYILKAIVPEFYHQTINFQEPISIKQ